MSLHLNFVTSHNPSKLTSQNEAVQSNIQSLLQEFCGLLSKLKINNFRYTILIDVSLVFFSSKFPIWVVLL